MNYDQEGFIKNRPANNTKILYTFFNSLTNFANIN